MKWKNILYDWKNYETYGGGGRWVFNKHKLFFLIQYVILLTIIIMDVIYSIYIINK